MYQRALLSVLVAVAVAGCGEAEILEPNLSPGCDAPRACQVAGIDLVVDPPVLVVDDDHARDALTGRLMFEPGEALSYVATVWNRGDEASVAATLSVYTPWGETEELAVPTLEPGGIFVDTVLSQAPSDMGFRSDTLSIIAEVYSLQAAEDPFHGNNRNTSDVIIVTLPVLRATLEFPDTVRTNEPFDATVTLTNISRFTDLEPKAMAFCLIDWDIGCGLSEVGAPFQLTDVPAIAAGNSWTTDMVVTVPPIDDYPEFEWRLVACIDDAGSDLADFTDWMTRSCVIDWSPLYVLSPTETAPVRSANAVLPHTTGGVR